MCFLPHRHQYLHSRPPQHPCSTAAGGLFLYTLLMHGGSCPPFPPAVPGAHIPLSHPVHGDTRSWSDDPLTLLLSCRDPDSVVLCLLAIDEEEEDDIALQIHFTLIQSFCCDNDIDIVRVSGMQRLAQLLGEPAETLGTTEARDLHCLLVTVSPPPPHVSVSLSPRPTHPSWSPGSRVCQHSWAGWSSTSSVPSHAWHVPWAA